MEAAPHDVPLYREFALLSPRMMRLPTRAPRTESDEKGLQLALRREGTRRSRCEVRLGLQREVHTVQRHRRHGRACLVASQEADSVAASLILQSGWNHPVKECIAHHGKPLHLSTDQLSCESHQD